MNIKKFKHVPSTPIGWANNYFFEALFRNEDSSFFHFWFPGVEWGHIEKSKFIKKVNREKGNFLTIL